MVKRGSVTIGVNREDLVTRRVTKEELKQSYQGGGYEKLATISLAMASDQSVANLIAVAFSLAIDGPEETLSRLIHMAKLPDPLITLVKVENVGDGDAKKMGAGGADDKNEDSNGNGFGNGSHSSIIWGIWESVKDYFKNT